MKHIFYLFLILAFTSACSQSADELTIYSGRSQGLVEPLVEQFEEETGIQVDVRYGETAQLAITLLEEGEQSPADLFWAQDAGALAQVAKNDLFETLPDSIGNHLPEIFQNSNGLWVATSGRARTLAYDAREVEENELPESIFDLTSSEWEGRVGWAPSNGSFQAFVTAMRAEYGDEETKEWLEGMVENDAQSYSNNTSIIQGISAKEIEVGIPNHYYLLRFKDEEEDFPVEQTFFEEGDIGNLVNVAGTGVIKNAEQSEAAVQFIHFLLSETGQEYITNEIFEYPVTDNVEAHPNLVGFENLLNYAPEVNLDSLDDLEATLELLREVDLL